MTSLFLVSVAFAQDPAPPAPEPAVPAAPAPEPAAPVAPAPAPAAPAPAPAEPGTIEVVVVGELAIQKARDGVVRDLEGLGYELAGERDGDLVFRPPHPWMGRAVFHRDGTWSFPRPVIGFSAASSESYAVDPRYESTTSGTNAIGANTPMEVGAGPWFWLLPSSSRLDPVQAKVIAGTRSSVDAYVDVVRRTAGEGTLDALPNRLDALWATGASLTPGGAPLATYAARRAEVLAYWASRADTPEGAAVCAAIEAWLDAVVQASDHPITADERARYQALRIDGRELP
ncbi:MAG: hypothetical protein ABMB14_25545 [Myxococcota bacterium]